MFINFYYMCCKEHLDTCLKKKDKSRKRKTQSIELFVTKKPRHQTANSDKPEESEELVCEEYVIDSDVDVELTATEVDKSQNA